ncbi:MAG: hypothetical protein RLP44_02490 [Aggregatilineales bacterium]
MPKTFKSLLLPTDGRVRTIRRSDASAAVSLRKVRRWYSDDGGGDGGSDGNDSDGGNGGGGEFRLEDLPPQAQAYIKELRNEAAANRVAAKKAQEEASKREQARLAEEGKWKELADARERELAEASPYKERATTLEAMIRESNAGRIEKVREEMRGMIPTDYPPEKLSGWLDSNWGMLTKPTATDTDAGAGGGGGKLTPLTAEEKRVAERSGMSEEDYQKSKERIKSAQG